VGNVTGFFHGGITVSDMDRSMSFYGNGLDLEMHFDKILDAPYLKEVLGLSFDQIRAVYYRIPGGGFVELLEYQGIERMPAAARPCDPGSGHLCLYVDDVQAAYDRLTSLGYRARHDGITFVTAGPNAGARSAYFADPDGYYVELFQKPAQA
jgi:catechol 2,3-dioxygenase-like lactoylglutathione lyase family enzyme